ncbi:MAG TPA: capsular biosynthesis protein [Clostridiales bacterium]|nr:capsular biosynthesis protein [Clostridiales bacterium]
MNVLVTGANGFLGRNLIENLKAVRDGKSKVFEKTDINILSYDINNSEEDLKEFCKQADFVYHLAGVNRPKDKSEFYSGNSDLTLKMLNLLSIAKKPPVMLSSSTWAETDNDYGKSKRIAENYVFEYSKTNKVKCFVYRFTNLFGKWARPSYNSVVATFCNNVAQNLPITVNDQSAVLKLNYIDDVVYELIGAFFGKETRLENGFCSVEKVYTVTVGELAEIIKSFKDLSRFPNCQDGLKKALFSTYLSYLPQNDLEKKPLTHSDERGSFTEIFKFFSGEQVSLNIVKKGKIKGNHWHNTKVERFTIIKGVGVIRLRKLGDDKILEYKNKLGEILSVDIPAGMTHNMENLGEEDLEVLIWCNEPLNPLNPDTFYEEV